MNVAIFASAFYPHVGGVEELVRQLAREYRKRGISPIILTNRWPRSLPKEELFEGTPLYRLAMRVPEGSLKARVNYRLTHRQICEEMFRILRKHHVNLLHVQCISANGFYALIAKRELNLPLIVTTQGERTMDATQLYQRSAFMNRTLRELLAEADHITACSQHTLDDMEQYWGKPFGERASVVYNGIDLENFKADAPYAHPRRYVLGIGRLVPQKGFDVLIRAFNRDALRDWDLLIAGEGPERESLEGLIEQLGLKERVKLTGRADRATAVALFQGCSLFVLPSRMEPFGIVNLEAMAAAKPIIASRTGGVPEIVADGVEGLLVDPEDENALSLAIDRFAQDAELRDKCGAAGRRKVDQFTWPTIAEQYLDIYSAMTANQSKMATMAPAIA